MGELEDWGDVRNFARSLVKSCPVEGFEGMGVRDRETWCCTTAFCSNGMLGCGLHVPGGSAARVRPPQGKPPGPQPGDYRPCRCRRDG